MRAIVKNLMSLCFFALIPCAGYANASEEDDFVASNIISVFYHELGHAVIDMMGVPIFGQEEDAADVFSILLIDQVFEPESANSIAYDAAFGFYAEARDHQPTFWDVHGPDEQRYYNLVCIFYGANPDFRDDLASNLGLPEERALSCQEEYELAIDSWGAVLNDMEALEGKLKLPQGSNSPNDLIKLVLSQEIEGFNAMFGFPRNVQISIEQCGEANAFYDPTAGSITICREFEEHLRRQFRNL